MDDARSLLTKVDEASKALDSIALSAPPAPRGRA
jgi:hypothetical protein